MYTHTHTHTYIYICTNIGITYCVTVCNPHVAYLQHSQVLYSVGPNNRHLVVVYPHDIVKDVVAKNRAQLLNLIWKIPRSLIKFRLVNCLDERKKNIKDRKKERNREEENT